MDLARSDNSGVEDNQQKIILMRQKTKFKYLHQRKVE